jgi:multimeric flavodoxin WrbA
MILLLNGSPNKDSKTFALTKQILKNTEQVVHIFNPYMMNIASCDDCKYCHYKNECIKNDDMSNIYSLLNETDTVIISSPIYFGHFSDPIMKLINRFQKYYSAKWIQKETNVPVIRNLVIVATAGHSEKMFQGITLTSSILSSLFSTTNVYHFFVPFSESNLILTTKQLKLIETIKNEVA